MKNKLILGPLLAWSLGSFGCAASPPNTQGQAQNQVAKETTTRKRGQPDVTASPQALLRKDRVKKLQAALEKKGYSTGKSGKLDEATEAALKKFQQKENIAATGLPDQLTLRRLDLDPKEILSGHAASKTDELELEPKEK